MARVPFTEGRLPVNIFRVMAHAPEVERGYLSLGGRLLSETSLDAKLRELVICALSVHLDTPYEWSHHAKPALDAGAQPADLEALRDGEHGRLGDLEAAVVTYALKVDQSTVSAADVDALRRYGLDEKAVVELTVLAGFYGMTARFLRAMDVELDEGTPAGYSLP